MIRTLSALGVVALVISPALALAAEPKLAEHFQPFAGLVGKTWRGEFKNSTPEKPAYDVVRFELALKGRAIRSRHSVTGGVYGGETLIVWDDQKKSLVSHYFTTAGFYTEGTFEVRDGKLISREKVRGSAPGVAEVEAVTTFADGKLHVKSRYLKDGQWVDGHEITYVEAPDAQVVLD